MAFHVDPTYSNSTSDQVVPPTTQPRQSRLSAVSASESSTSPPNPSTSPTKCHVKRATCQQLVTSPALSPQWVFSGPNTPNSSPPPSGFWVDPNYLEIDLSETRRRHRLRRSSTLDAGGEGGGGVGVGLRQAGREEKLRQRAQRSLRLKALLDGISSTSSKI